MRDIKFRAYSHDTKTMYPYAIQGFVGELWVHKNTPHNGEWKNIGCGNDEGIVDYSYELMQSTGLLDKNGKEIYEGDIVYAFAESQFPNETIISDIICNTADGMRFEVRCSKDSQHGLSIGWGGWESFEVRGNIYENPELLKS